MPTWIVTHSEFLCNYLLPLVAGFSPAQLRHALNFIEALLVCSAKPKTLSALTRLLRLDHADQDHVIELFGNTKDTNFSLNVTIPRRISFNKGAVSAMVTGKTGGHRSVTYLLRASGGQTMTAALTSPNNNVGLTIYGLSDGQPLVWAVSEAKSWTGKLPATQDYMIVAVPVVDTASFTLQVTVK